MFCSKCGTQLSDDSKFCAGCGAPVDAQPPVSDVIPAEPSVNATQDMPMSADNLNAETQNQPTYPPTAPAAPKKGLKGWHIALIVVGAILALLILLIVIGSSSGNKGGNSGTSSGSSNASANNHSGSVSTGKDDVKVQEYIDQANESANKGNYDEAFALLDTAEQLCGKNSKIDAARVSIEKAQLTKTVEQYETSGDLAEAIKAIDRCKSSIKNDNEIVQKRNSLKQAYISKVIESADAVLKSDGYEAAVAIINEALKVLPNEAAFSQKIEEYQSYAPVHVKKLVATKQEDCSFFETERDPRGKDYTDGLILYSHSINWISSDGLIEFYTGKEYSTFNCEIVPEAEYSTTSGYGGRIKIYSDNDLIYTSEVITYKTTSIKVELNISNTDYLKIRIENVSPSGVQSAYADTLLVNPYVKK